MAEARRLVHQFLDDLPVLGRCPNVRDGYREPARCGVRRHLAGRSEKALFAEPFGDSRRKRFAQAAQRTRRVKRWEGPRMILRWTAAALLEAEKRFKRIRGCEQLKDLEKVLRKLEATSTLKAA